MPFGKIHPEASLTIYECSVCGAVGRRGIDTIWFGSIADSEAGSMACLCDWICIEKFKQEPEKYYTPYRVKGYGYIKNKLKASDLRAIRNLGVK